MSKDKLITIRIEAEKREQFKAWAKEQNLDVSEFLTTVIQACLDEQLDKNLTPNPNPPSESVCIDSLDQKINQLITRLDKRIDKLEEQVNELIIKLDKRIDKNRNENINKQKAILDPLKQPINEQLTNAELARLINVSPSTISRWVNQKSKLPLDLEWQYDPKLKKWVK